MIQSNNNIAKPCKICGKAITSGNSNKQFCSNACKQKFYRYGNDISNMETVKNIKSEPVNNKMVQVANLSNYNFENLSEIVMETKAMIEKHFEDFNAVDLELFLYYKFKYSLNQNDLLSFMKWRSESNCDNWLYSYELMEMKDLNSKKEFENFIAFNNQLRKFL